MTIRSERAHKFEEIRKDLARLGYDPLRPVCLDRYMRYRLLVVAVNHLATVLGRDPYRVYQALLCRAERTTRGRPFTPYKQAKPQQDGPLEGWVGVWCPFCGGNILEAGPVTHEEVTRDRKLDAKARRAAGKSDVPADVPTVKENEQQNDTLSTWRRQEKGCFSHGPDRDRRPPPPGGRDPGGGPRNVEEPRPPL